MEKTGDRTGSFSTRRWFLQRCWGTLCLCWRRWARISLPESTKRSHEVARTNGPPTSLKSSLNMHLSVRRMFWICIDLILKPPLEAETFHPFLRSTSCSGQLGAVRGALGLVAGLHWPWSSTFHRLHQSHVQDHLPHALHTSSSATAAGSEGVAGPRGGVGRHLQPRYDSEDNLHPDLY